MRRLRFVITPLLFLSLAGTQAAAAPETESGRIPVMTRLVQSFMQLETRLDEALAKRDKAAVGKLLAEDFEMRTGAVPGSPVPRAEWLRQSFAEAAPPRRIEQMAVHDYGKLAAVSYAWKDKTGGTAAHELFIVDIWTKERGDWQLTVRYASPAGTGEIPIPGAASAPAAFEKKE